MSYTIFAIIVTIIFGLYIAVLISTDVLGAKKKKGESTEVFDNSSFSDAKKEESSVMVQETSDNGAFKVNYPGYAERQEAEPPSGTETAEDSSALPVGGEDGPASSDIQPQENPLHGASTESEKSVPSLYEQARSVHDNQCGVAVPTYQSEYESEAFNAYWNNHTIASTRIAAQMIAETV